MMMMNDVRLDGPVVLSGTALRLELRRGKGWLRQSTTSLVNMRHRLGFRMFIQIIQ